MKPKDPGYLINKTDSGAGSVQAVTAATATVGWQMLPKHTIYMYNEYSIKFIFISIKLNQQ